MQMVDTHFTVFVNVQKTPCVVQNIYPMNSSDVKCYLSNRVMKNALFSNILYTINKKKLIFILNLVFNNAQFLFSISIYRYRLLYANSLISLLFDISACSFLIIFTIRIRIKTTYLHCIAITTLEVNNLIVLFQIIFVHV